MVFGTFGSALSSLSSTASAFWANPYGKAVSKKVMDTATGGWSGFASDLYEAVWEDGLSPAANPYFIHNGFDDLWSPRTNAFFNAYRLRAAKSFLGFVPGLETGVKANTAWQSQARYMTLNAMTKKLHDRSRLAAMLGKLMEIKAAQASLAGAGVAADVSTSGLLGLKAMLLGTVSQVQIEVETGKAKDFFGPEIAALSEWLHWRAFTELKVGRGQATGPALRICRELARGSLGHDYLGVDAFIMEPKGHWVIAHNLDSF
jgi:hypothetical protein